ncbi:hypothetical protein CC78DRAFT_574101 [Lojkania enalia]|uniref:Uncharacterized protein n=1 Tax=Lojkania enalia TaxID=147567 RepID=A0A9P4TQW6_9PLEO|nr:hypothetical protein CC78DRAFT_574101 [Didymosphaeria enalia]
MVFKIPGLPKIRLTSSYCVIVGNLVGVTAGLYVALNLLGAGGGKPNSAEMVQIVHATLCAVWFSSALFGGTILNKVGPAITACLGIGTPIFAGTAIGLSAGLIFITMGYVAMSYSEEQDRRSYITMLMNLQAVGAVIGGIIPLIINRNSVASSLWHYIILYFLGCFSNSPRNAANYAQGVFRGFLGAGEAICFGLDSVAVPYTKEAAVIFAFYTAGIFIFLYLALFHISETEYSSHEEGVVIPKHVLEEAEVEGGEPGGDSSEKTSIQDVKVNIGDQN